MSCLSGNGGLVQRHQSSQVSLHAGGIPGASTSELLPKLTRNFVKEGYMEKTGPKHTEGSRRDGSPWMTGGSCTSKIHWMPMHEARCSLEAVKTAIQRCPPPAEHSGLPLAVWNYHSYPDRKFLLVCETEEDQKDWIAALQTVINRPMLPQEYAVQAYFKHNRDLVFETCWCMEWSWRNKEPQMCT
ncbi:hypothetical protein FQN60_006291 [Etheostoma spectabile]|uniref:PH domain-containing protein n=1 Tax=Etheostoma spectabile TaxID=54343 RepID=A0A5J5CQG8_9PERO|nr:hypothetical protein FQN60_006291 [Etheostoma spectabile]